LESAPDDAVTQRIVDFPAITLSIEEGDVPAPFVVTSVRPGAWSRVIAGRGSVFAMRLKPAGLAVLSDLHPLSLAPEQPLTHECDERGHRMLHEISRAGSAPARAARADEIVSAMLDERPLTRTQRLANAAVEALTATPQVRPGSSTAGELGVSERTLQRALRETIGLGPNDVARRIRLQEVVRRLSAPDADAAAIAVGLGYVDQAHLINEFRTVAGTTPGRYMRRLRQTLDELRP
jgi:AraC-like DNA-binding protein